MARKDFTLQQNIPIQNILLDTENARIRAGSDQNNCISRILKKEKQMLVLMEDIAKNGLTTMPIIVMPEGNGKLVVKDGNRRITALKLLNSPEICPEPHLIPSIKKIVEKYKNNIVSEVDCYVSDNEDAVFQEIVARHSGARDGAGQYDWFAYMRTVYLLNNGHPTDYKRAGQYMCWAEKEGLDVEDDFPISTTARFFNKENLKLLGFEIENDVLVPILSKDKILKMASKINDDFSQKIVDVNTVFKPEDALNYLMKVRQHAGIVDQPDIDNKSKSSDGSDSTDSTGADNSNPNQPTQPGTEEVNKSSDDDNSNSQPKPTARGGNTPRKNPHERNKILGRGKIGIPVRDDEVKVKTIIAELRELDVKKTTLAVTALLRALLELSDREYRELHSIPDKKGLAKNIAASADHMLNNNLINSSEHNIIIAYTRGEQGMLHIETLQKFLHRETHHPDYVTLNVFWENIGCFVRACWKQ
ncbi:ParB/Srx family N-terminal domain-containing protein [Yersinia alsatica]|uniref:ParB/Srx family N-terminal domain-containing protein n=1 Tax=Yersinia alsatica TaxID=2890317 RepID=UPI0011A2BBC1|nr:ParB/Srx family N-terminal domain-containing protein [Yersinia alsatica]